MCRSRTPTTGPPFRKICDDNDVLLIADEVITGFGRTGKMFASEHWDLKPDIMTVAKGLSSGYAPIGATIASKAVADTFIGEREKAFGHLLTFGGNPVSAAAAMANLDIMIGENMVDNSAEMGSYLHEQLQVLYEHPIVGDINGGLGLFFGIELVKDRDTKEKFGKDDDIGSKLTPLLLERQLLTRQRGDHVWLAPTALRHPRRGRLHSPAAQRRHRRGVQQAGLTPSVPQVPNGGGLRAAPFCGPGATPGILVAAGMKPASVPARGQDQMAKTPRKCHISVTFRHFS